MLNVSWHTYEPAFANTKLKSSAGGGAWMRTLFDAFNKEKFNMIWMPHGPVPKGAETFDRYDYDEIDVAVFAWRWPMPNYPERDQAYRDQMLHIQSFIEAGVPILVHDQDHKISEPDRSYLIDNGVVIAEPSLLPMRGARKLMFPNPYAREEDRLKVQEHRVPFLSYYKLVYVGNNYGRFDQTVSFLAPFSAKYPTKVYGNWLEPNPERESAEQVRAAMPNVEFGIRIQQQMTVQALAEADTTIHLFKPSYGPCGFTTIRWAEAAAAQTFAFIPSDFQLPDEWISPFAPAVVRDGEHMKEVFGSIDEAAYLNVLRAQEAFVETEMKVQPWIDIVKELADRGGNNYAESA